MEVVDRNRRTLTPPWIALEFSFPVADLRHLDNLHNDYATVRIAEYEGTRDSMGTYKERTLDEIKDTFKLFNTDNVQILEPEESEIRCIGALRRWSARLVHCGIWLMSMLAIAVICLRLYTSSCFHHFENLTQVLGTKELPGALGGWNTTEPIPYSWLDEVHQFCKANYENRGFDEGSNACIPTYAQVLETCNTLPPSVKRPVAFQSLHKAVTWFSPLQCEPHVCEHFRLVKDQEVWVEAGCLLAVLFGVLVVRPCVAHSVELWRRSQIHEKNKAIQAQGTRSGRGSQRPLLSH
eukprot:SRR837773.16112.p2 GENE.SRR837773.16112~~SRR837773.16112.p2  ORF type:complete len:294 (-),score=97.81 SRR837773.16112:196-1077(-)